MLGVEAGLLEELLVVDQAHRVAGARDAVDLPVDGVDVAELLLKRAVALQLLDVRGEIGGLVDVHDVPGVGEVRVEDVLHLAAGELGVEGLGVLAGEGVVCDDVDVRVLLLEGRDVLLEEPAVDLGALGRHAVDRDTGLAARRVVARSAGGDGEGKRTDTERGDGTAVPGASHRWTPRGRSGGRRTLKHHRQLSARCRADFEIIRQSSEGGRRSSAGPTWARRPGRLGADGCLQGAHRTRAGPHGCVPLGPTGRTRSRRLPRRATAARSWWTWVVQSRGACAVDPRTTSSGSKSSSSGGTALPPTCAFSSSTAARPMASMGWRTVVSGGSVQFIRAESS